MGADVSPTTVEAVLGKMVKDGSVKKIGSARATKYVNAKHVVLYAGADVLTWILKCNKTLL